MLTLWPPCGTTDRKYHQPRRNCTIGLLIIDSPLQRDRPFYLFASSSRDIAFLLLLFPARFCWRSQFATYRSFKSSFLIFGSIYERRKEQLAWFNLRLREKIRKIEFRIGEEIKNEFRLFRPSFILCKFVTARACTPDLSRIIASLVFPSFNIQKKIWSIRRNWGSRWIVFLKNYNSLDSSSRESWTW